MEEWLILQLQQCRSFHVLFPSQSLPCSSPRMGMPPPRAKHSLTLDGKIEGRVVEREGLASIGLRVLEVSNLARVGALHHPPTCSVPRNIINCTALQYCTFPGMVPFSSAQVISICY